MIHTLNLNSPVTVTIKADELYSSAQLAVKAGERYLFFCDPKQRWKDWWVPSSPNGFFNPLALLHGLRVKGTKCFCLCATYINPDELGFPIGSFKQMDMHKTGVIAFFANDAIRFYDNNSGCVDLTITRII